MEFNEKLQQLRKSKGLTQEELAEFLFVSRTAVSKWESGRGYPSVDSLKDISEFFSVSIDALLSGEKLLLIAEKENKSNLKSLCDMLSGFTDLFALMLVILPIYPHTIDGFVYSVNLLSYTEISYVNKLAYWSLFGLLILSGILKLIFTKIKKEKINKMLTTFSVVVNAFAVMFLALAREPYAAVVSFVILATKGLIIFKCYKEKV